MRAPRSATSSADSGRDAAWWVSVDARGCGSPGMGTIEGCRSRVRPGDLPGVASRARRGRGRGSTSAWLVSRFPSAESAVMVARTSPSGEAIVPVDAAAREPLPSGLVNGTHRCRVRSRVGSTSGSGSRVHGRFALYSRSWAVRRGPRRMVPARLCTSRRAHLAAGARVRRRRRRRPRSARRGRRDVGRTGRSYRRADAAAMRRRRGRPVRAAVQADAACRPQCATRTWSAITTWSRSGARASPTSSSLTYGP